jgi:hypothetical protein
LNDLKNIDMLSTYVRKANIPLGLQSNDHDLPVEVNDLMEEIKHGKYSHKIIVLHGLRRGKTTSAASLLMEFLRTRQGVVSAETPGLFVSVNQLCYQNRSVDRYNRDENLQVQLRLAANADFLVLDGVFSYLTQNDDLMLQALYDARQHASKTTVITTGVLDPTECAGSILFRMFRDADIKVVF